MSVHDDYAPAGQRGARDLRHGRPYHEVVGVAPDGAYGCDRFELRQQVERTDIARMQSVLDARKMREHFRTKLPVRVGNDADLHARLTATVTPTLEA